jgi:hypothetical protein
MLLNLFYALREPIYRQPLPHDAVVVLAQSFAQFRLSMVEIIEH